MKCFAVDDEPMVLSLLERTIREAAPACTVQAFGSALDALAAVDAGTHPDVAFLDIEMYDMTGLALAKALRERSPETKIVFVTGYAEYALEAFNVRARGYVLKPVTVEKIRAELEDVQEPARPPRWCGCRRSAISRCSHTASPCASRMRKQRSCSPTSSTAAARR